MEKRLQAVYRDGALQPLESLPLDEMQQVTITISDSANVWQDAAAYFTPEEWAEAVHDDVGLDEVRRALSTISGALSEMVVTLRQER
jgi:hypothetical protein